MSDELVVVTVTYSPGPHLNRFLATLSLATDRPVTVMIADNGSIDGAPEEALETFDNVRVFRTGSNLGNYHNADFDGMVDQAQTQMDEKQRLAIYHRINKLWIDDMPAVPLYQQLDLYGANKRLNWKARSDELIKAYDMSIK